MKIPALIDHVILRALDVGGPASLKGLLDDLQERYRGQRVLDSTVRKALERRLDGGEIRDVVVGDQKPVYSLTAKGVEALDRTLEALS